MDFTDFTPARVQEAREKVAIEKEHIAASYLNGVVDFPAHVTLEMKQTKAAQRLTLADQIRRGEHDRNVSIRQRIDYYLTEKSSPLM